MVFFLLIFALLLPPLHNQTSFKLGFRKSNDIHFWHLSSFSIGHLDDLRDDVRTKAFPCILPLQSDKKKQLWQFSPLSVSWKSKFFTDQCSQPDIIRNVSSLWRKCQTKRQSNFYLFCRQLQISIKAKWHDLWHGTLICPFSL